MNRSIEQTPLLENVSLTASPEKKEQHNGKNYLVSHISMNGKPLPVPMLQELAQDGKEAPEDYTSLVKRRNDLNERVQKILQALDAESGRSLHDRVFNIGGVRSEGKHHDARIMSGNTELLNNEQFLKTMGFSVEKNPNNMYVEAQKLAGQFPDLGGRPMIGMFMDWVRSVHTDSTRKK